MTQSNHQKADLLTEAKVELGSLIKLIAQFFLGALVILIFTGGKPSGFTVGLSFFSGVIFLAWKEKVRLTGLKQKTKNNSLIINSENKFRSLVPSSEKTLDLQKVKSTGVQYRTEHAPKSGSGSSKKTELLELLPLQAIYAIRFDNANLSLEELTYALEPSHNILVQAILASWSDGVLILTEQGKLIYANEMARQICDRLTPGDQFFDQVPEDIWQVCQALVLNLSQYPEAPVIVESEISINEASHLRIRARWFEFGRDDSPHFLVTLEGRGQFVQSLPISKVTLYGLTPREAEVWLFHCMNYTYKEIAAELYISINTVKKHMKNIRRKRQIALLQRMALLR
ncbi:MAG: LuxR C-terminal-related transcriptional regulator [Leptolyngbyaceae cyanobacterium MO_188.B28]|nr:LuxR C-terminal-related transcriptional regulator [Leptolyngbyaceae cyanobacterium MO_188.B28]